MDTAYLKARLNNSRSRYTARGPPEPVIPYTPSSSGLSSFTSQDAVCGAHHSYLDRLVGGFLLHDFLLPSSEVLKELNESWRDTTVERMEDPSMAYWLSEDLHGGAQKPGSADRAGLYSLFKF